MPTRCGHALIPTEDRLSAINSGKIFGQPADGCVFTLGATQFPPTLMLATFV